MKKNVCKSVSYLLAFAMVFSWMPFSTYTEGNVVVTTDITIADEKSIETPPVQAPAPEPTSTPTAEPTSAPTAEPTSTPTAEPTSAQTPEPTSTPTAEPTSEPTAEPTSEPMAEPTNAPTPSPSAQKDLDNENAEAEDENLLMADFGMALFSLAGMAPRASTDYGITVAGVAITSENLVVDNTDVSSISGSATYDLATNTLTLNGLTISGAYVGGVITTNKALNINIVGTNNITNGTANGIQVTDYTVAITLTGNGELNLTAGSDLQASGISGTTNIISGTITTTASASSGYGVYGAVIMSGGDLRINTSGAAWHGIATSLKISGGTVTTTVTGGAASGIASGLEMTGGTVKASSSNYPAVSGATTISCGTLEAQGTTALNGSLDIRDTIEGSSEKKTVTINSGADASASEVDADTFTIGSDQYTKIVVGNCSGGITPPADNFTLTYNSNTGASSTTQLDEETGKQITVNSNTFANTGYKFVSWNTKADGKGTTYQPNSSITLTENTILYAIWQKEHTITFDPNYTGGTPTTEKVEDGDSTTTPTETVVTRPGYELDSWNTNQDGTGEKYEPGTAITPDSDETLYAQWKYTLSYNINNGTGIIPADKVLKENETTTIANDNLFEKDGFVFKGWSTTQNGTVEYTKNQSDVKFNGNTTLYAVWEEKVTLQYDANGVTGVTVPNTKIVEKGTTLAVGGVTGYDENHYRFTGWNTQASGGGDAYATSGDITIDANTTLYAQWEQLVTLKYNLNGATGTPPVSVTQVLNSYVNISTTIPTRDNYTFLGWDLNKDSTTAAYGTNHGQIRVINLDSDKELFAIWQKDDAGITDPVTVTITYSSNGKTATVPQPNTVEKGQKVTIGTATAFDSAEYNFLGWSTNSSATVADSAYAKNTIYTLNADLTLYAVWQKIHTVGFDKGDSDSGTPPVDKDVDDGDSIVIPDKGTLEKPDHEFEGWQEDTNGDGTPDGPIVKPGDSFTPDEDTTFYPVWTYNPILTYNANDSSGRTATDAEIGASKTVDANSFTRSGYTFLYWTINQAGVSQIYRPGNAIALTDDMVLYAQWQVNSSGGGGTTTPATPVPATPTPTPTPTIAPVVTATPTPTPTATPEASTTPEPLTTATPSTEPTTVPTPDPTDDGTNGGGGTTEQPSVDITPEGGIDIDTTKPTEPPINVQIDGNDLDDDLYIFEDGNLSILPEAFENLDDGEHIVTVEYENSEPTQTAVITDNGVPLSANVIGFAGWSLFDLLMTILTFILAVLYILRKKYKANDDEEEDFESEEEREEKYKKQRLIKVIGVLLFIITLIFLLVTQDFTLPMIIFDKYSLAFAILAIVQLLAGILTAKRNKKQDEKAKHA